MSKMACEICEDPNATIYEPNNEGFYCISCYEEYKTIILCNCDGSCKTCQETY